MNCEETIRIEENNLGWYLNNSNDPLLQAVKQVAIIGHEVARSDLKITTEALLFSAQEQAIRTNYIKFHIDKSTDSPSCRMCGERGDTKRI